VKTRLAIALLCLVAVAAAQANRGAEMWLEVPAAGMRVPANTVVHLPSADVSTFRVHLLRQPSAVNFGTVYARINAEAANMVMTTQAEHEGIVAVFDLERRGGFRLHGGRNTVEIAYYDQWRRQGYASWVLVAPGREWVELERGRQPDRQKREKYAVVVGVSRQVSAAIPVLRYANRDASSFYDFLLSPVGGSFRPDHVRLLLDEAATANNLESSLLSVVLHSQPEDMIVLFFSMHAAPDPTDQRNFYLLSYDADPKRMATTAFPIARLEELASRNGHANYVVAFADICRAYGVGEGNAPANNLTNQYFHRALSGGKRAVITASDVTELSLEGERWGGGHGVFTWQLLTGLEGDADANRDGGVTVAELSRYLEERVPSASASQHPMASPGLAADLSLATIVRGSKK